MYASSGALVRLIPPQYPHLNLPPAVTLLTLRRLQVMNYQTVGLPRAPLDGHVENRVWVCVWVWYRRAASSCGDQTAISKPHVAKFREPPAGAEETYSSSLYL